jgi:Spy/CpxP family protein refolding chaperone
MTLNRFGFLIGAAVLAAATSAAAAPQNTTGDGGAFIGRDGRIGRFGLFHPGRRLAAELGLSDAQKDQIKAVAESHKDEWQALAGRAREARQALHAAVTADQIDEGLIRQRSAELANVQADLSVARARAHAEIFRVLTPDQQAKAKALRAQFAGKIRDRRRSG